MGAFSLPCAGTKYYAKIKSPETKFRGRTIPESISLYPLTEQTAAKDLAEIQTYVCRVWGDDLILIEVVEAYQE